MTRQVGGWWRSRRRYRQRQCRHIGALGIYGDGINITGKRGVCLACGMMLDALPMEVEPTGLQPIPALPDYRGGYEADPLFIKFIRPDVAP